MPVTSYRDLEVWRLSMDLTRLVYRATSTMPWPHRSEIGSQMRRSAMSVPSNIAEGFRQGASRAYLRHLRIAAGSAAELETQAELASDLGLWPDDEGPGVRRLAERTSQMISALIKALQKQAERRPA